MPKATTPASVSRRHNPLEDDLTASGGILKNKPGKRKSRHQEEGDQFVDSKASRKILKLGQELADESEATEKAQNPKPVFTFESRSDGEEDETYEDDEEAWGGIDEEVEEVDVDELAPEDLATFNKFFPTQEDPLLRQGWGGEDDGGADEDEGQGTNLADLILEKIAAHEAAQAAGGNGARDVPGPIDEDLEIPPKVVEVYTKYVILAFPSC
jgi:essential nuclear protein 1